MTDTDKSELQPSERDTLPPEAVSLEEVRAALAESNALSILSREASEKCSNLCMRLLHQLQISDVVQRDHGRRLSRIERHLGLTAE